MSGTAACWQLGIRFDDENEGVLCDRNIQFCIHKPQYAEVNNNCKTFETLIAIAVRYIFEREK